ncbi:LCP family glycopolymer transferase [Kineosporia succinea]|uniref:LCP family protein required for cell wall assembly n=1 Tax=Kineosporia succinea TaxID=84632 RepID=A0ABT9P0I7_9ACTN|nr:LCP family protein [Kineosporia succinea]MDP9826188.1 LCP family protein required for cell wall assembly [Kineosporia succinea]
MTQVEPFSRRPRRSDADTRYGEQSRNDAPPRSDQASRADRGSRARFDDQNGYDNRYDETRRPPSRYDETRRAPDQNRPPAGRYDEARYGEGRYDRARPDERSDPHGRRDPRETTEPRSERTSSRSAARSQGRPEARSGAGPAGFEGPGGFDGGLDGPGGSGPEGPRRQSSPLPPPGDDNDRRGSHATTYGQGFSWVMAWTILGALIPGLGLIAAGWRRLGAGILAGIALTGAGVAVWALTGNVMKKGVSFAFDPQKLLILAIVAVLVGMLWALVILLTNSQLRRYATLDTSQKVFSGIVVAALIVGVGVPTYTVGDYALVQRDLVKSLFGDGSDSEDGDKKPDSEAADPWAGTERINVLLIGSDAGATREGIRPDTMILASIQPSTGNTVLFSIPRSLQRVPFKEGTPGAEAWPNGYYCPEAGPGNECMINAIWRWAEGDGASYYPKSKYKNPGLKATEDAVTGATGLEIDTYAMLNLKGFADFIDAIGGLTLNVTERLPIGGNSSNPVAKEWIEVGQNQNMNGYYSLWYARSRWSTNDYDRMRRQRCVIAAVTEQADPVTIASNWTKIAKALKNNMATGIPQSDIQAWVELATRVKGGKVTSLSFTNEAVGGTTVDPDFDLMHTKVQTAIKKSEKAKKKKSTATAAASPSASADAGTGTTTDKTTDKTKTETAEEKAAKADDPENAQDVTEIC